SADRTGMRFRFHAFVAFPAPNRCPLRRGLLYSSPLALRRQAPARQNAGSRDVGRRQAGRTAPRTEALMTTTDEDATRQIELRFNEAWGRHDPDGMVESLVEDANFVTVNGAWTRTRADFHDLMRRLHGPDGPFRASTRETPQMDVRFLAPDVAVALTRFHIYGDKDESERTSIGTRVLRKIDGRWRTVAVQNTDVRRNRRH